MTRERAIEVIRDLRHGRSADPFWTDEMKEGYRHACREITEALDAAGAFDPPDVPPDLARQIAAWNARRAGLTSLLEDAGYVEYTGADEWRVTPAGREAGLK